jgi:DNA-binding NarL/FixJ family response regulator
MNLSKLTPAETKVFHLLSQGKSNKEIAKILKVKVGTIKTHAFSCYKKLNIHSRIEIILKCK